MGDILKELLTFDDAGAGDDHPAKGVTVGHIRSWFDEIERFRDERSGRAWEVIDEKNQEIETLRKSLEGCSGAILQLHDDMNAMAITNGKRLDEIERLTNQLEKAKQLLADANDMGHYIMDGCNCENCNLSRAIAVFLSDEQGNSK